MLFLNVTDEFIAFEKNDDDKLASILFFIKAEEVKSILLSTAFLFILIVSIKSELNSLSMNNSQNDYRFPSHNQLQS